MRAILIAVSAAYFFVPAAANAARAPVGGVVTQFCDVRYCGASESLAKVRVAKRKHRQARHRQAKVRAPMLPRALATFMAPAGAVCAPLLAPMAGNILHTFRDQIAAVVEPVRPGFVAIKTASGKRAVVAVAAAGRFAGFIRDLEATGYRILDIGGYAYRRIAGTRTLSKHAFGMAIDINQDARDVVTVPMNRAAVSRLAAANNLCSGGDWSRPDLGHFEVCGGSGQARRRVRHVRHIRMAAAPRYAEALPAAAW